MKKEKMIMMEDTILRSADLLKAGFALEGQAEDPTLIFDEALLVLERCIETLQI